MPFGLGNLVHMGRRIQPLPLPEKKDQTQPLQWERGGTLTPQPWRPVPKPTSLLGEASLQFLKIKSTLNLNLADFVTVCITCLKILDIC